MKKVDRIVSIEDIRGAIRESFADGSCEDDAEKAISKLESCIFNSDNYAESK